MNNKELNNKIEKRVNATLNLFDSFIASRPAFKDFDVQINIDKLVQAISDYFQRSENFKLIHEMNNSQDFTNSAKRASLTMLSLFLNSPLYYK